MASATSIEWTDFNWNFLRGCSRVSEGCRNCYAERQAIRASAPGGAYYGLVESTPKGPRWTGNIEFFEHILLEPLKWKKPRKVFVNSMSDLFHEKVKDEWLDKAFDVMYRCPQHIFQILTKRPERMLDYISRSAFLTNAPLENVWLGVSCEDQKTADERIPHLLQTPAAVRWVSAEPLLGPIDFKMPTKYQQKLDLQMGASFYLGELLYPNWIVVGGESGPRSRPFDIAWCRSIIGQCRAADVPVFVKQLGANFQDPENAIGGCQTKTPEEYGQLHRRLTNKKGGDPSEWPEDLRVREFPR